MARALPLAPGPARLSGNRRRKDENDGPRARSALQARPSTSGGPRNGATRSSLGATAPATTSSHATRRGCSSSPSSSTRCPSSPARRSAAGARRAPATATCSHASPTRSRAGASPGRRARFATRVDVTGVLAHCIRRSPAVGAARTASPTERDHRRSRCTAQRRGSSPQPRAALNGQVLADIEPASLTHAPAQDRRAGSARCPIGELACRIWLPPRRINA